MNSQYKKELGYWGEEQLDKWMETKQWFPYVKNLKIPGGEIDRAYYKDGEEKRTICVVEIKTNSLYTKLSYDEIFTEVGAKKYLKQRQIQNIYKYGIQLINQKKCHEIFLRIFIVLKINFKKHFLNNQIKSGIKICFSDDKIIILSICPEYTTVSARKSLLQIKI